MDPPDFPHENPACLTTLKIQTFHQRVPATHQHAFWENRASLNPKKAATCSHEPNGDLLLFQRLPEETENCTGYGNSFQQANWTNPRFFTCTTKNSVHSFPNVFLTTIWVKQIHKQTYMQTNRQPNNQANEANPS